LIPAPTSLSSRRSLR